MAKRKKKVISELDESIIRECKKNRIFSKIKKHDLPDDLFKHVIDTVELLHSNKEVKYLYIMDVLYPQSDLNFLVSAPDSSMIVINNDDLFNRLLSHEFNLTDDLVIKFIRDNSLLEKT
jgi:hypothetical protein